MKAALCVLVALLACTAQARPMGRSLLQDQGCADLSILGGFPELSEIATVITDFNLLSSIPAGVTVFLPSNEGVSALLDTLGGFLGTSNVTADQLSELVTETPVLASLVAPKLTSAVIYHIVPSGAYTPEELAAAGTLTTALGAEYTLTFGGTAGAYTVTDASDAVANVLGEPVAACGSQIYIVDKVLLPTAEVLTIPDTSPEEAAALLGGGAPAAAPAAA